MLITSQIIDWFEISQRLNTGRVFAGVFDWFDRMWAICYKTGDMFIQDKGHFDDKYLGFNASKA